VDRAEVQEASRDKELMRALIVHIGEGTTHVLLATTRFEDTGTLEAKEKPNPLVPRESKTRNHDFFIMHDMSMRNGVDLSLRLSGALDADLATALFAQADEALSQFSDVADALSLSISSSLIYGKETPRTEAEWNDRNTLPKALQEVLGKWDPNFHVLNPAAEALWTLRGVRGRQPKGEIGCASIGYWNTTLAWERPGSAPKLLTLELGNSRESYAQIDEELQRLPLGRGTLYLTGENAWILASMKSGLTFHSAEILDETFLSLEDFKSFEQRLLPLTVDERNSIPMLARRGEILPEIISCTRTLVEATSLGRLPVCSFGLPHGLAANLLFEGRKAK
jgi:hypothetical protein